MLCPWWGNSDTSRGYPGIDIVEIIHFVADVPFDRVRMADAFEGDLDRCGHVKASCVSGSQLLALCRLGNSYLGIAKGRLVLHFLEPISL